MAQTVAIIPARGGSKGIPRKNIKLFCGKPLIAWTILAAKAANLVDCVYVSTDDDHIARVSREWGADVIQRPIELATDTASSESALLHAVETLETTHGLSLQTIVFLQCTSPFTSGEEIDQVVNLIKKQNYDSAVTAVPFHHFIWEKESETGSMEGVNHDKYVRLRRQDRTPEYLEVGAAYAMNAAGFKLHQHRFFGKIGSTLIPSYKSLEIDSLDDWIVAEQLMQTYVLAEEEKTTLNWSVIAKKIKVIVTDFDGVLTDNRVYLNENGEESVACNRGDGWGINLLKNAGYKVACLSTEKNPVVAMRCEKLQIPYWQGLENKLETLKALLHKNDYVADQCLYIGNDTNDAACLEYAGVSIVPADAASIVKPLAHGETNARGGEGVIREIAHYLSRSKEVASL